MPDNQQSQQPKTEAQQFAPPQNVQDTTSGPVVTYDSQANRGENESTTPKANLKDKLAVFESFKKYLKFVKLAIILVIVLAVLLIAYSFASRFLGNGNGGLLATPTPTPSANQDDITNPSVYANDPEVLGIDAKIKELDEVLRDSTFRESTLSLPSLDWNVNF